MAQRDWHRMGVLGAAGLLLALPVVMLLVWLVGPVWGSLVQAQNDADLVRRFKTLTAEKPAYQAALLQAQQRLNGENALYHEASAELAGAQLQNAVQNLVAAAGGQMQSSEIGTPQTSQGIQTINVSLSFSLPQERLGGLLAALDTERPYLVVGSLDVRGTDAGDRHGALQVELQVDGFQEIP